MDDLIGLPEGEAQEICKKCGFAFRVTSRDGVKFMLTQDLRHDRVNVTVVNNIVTKAYEG